MIQTCSLAERVLDAFPSGNYALLALARLFEIEESTAVATAAIECKTSPKLLMNPDFVAARANTSERLFMLVMHELHHLLLGHTTLYKRVTEADNLAFDAVINSALCHLFPQEEYTSLFTSINSDREFPACFLRPPEGWRPGKNVARPPALAGSGMEKLAHVYSRLYSEAGIDYQELIDALKEALPGSGGGSGGAGDSGGQAVLLGSHEKDNQTPLDGMLLEAVRSVVEKWPQPPNPIIGRSWEEILNERKVGLERVPSNRAILRRLLAKVARLGCGATHRVVTETPIELTTPVFHVSRRWVVERALGREPLLFRAPVTMRRPEYDGERVHVYLDVSGSMTYCYGAVFGAVADCAAFVHPTIHQFSTRVEETGIRAVRAGHCVTTGGTDISCVAAHMRERRIRRAVIITDGYVGRPSHLDAETLRNATVGVALAPNCYRRSDLEGFVTYWEELHREAK